MGKTVSVRSGNVTLDLKVDNYPDTCPFCHKGMDPRLYGGYLYDSFYNIEVIFQCPLLDCQHLFIGYYYGEHFPGDPRGVYILNTLAPINFEPREMGKIIDSVSKDFGRIYNQAAEAEELGLDEIAGPGYRKSLEFLIKDYVISKRPDKEEEVKNLLLGKVIPSYVDDPRIQDTATRAAWLGNDETHYYRKWEDKDISDLKRLIELTVRWIESVELTEEYKNTMPKGRN
jgi:hypothetical protein